MDRQKTFLKTKIKFNVPSLAGKEFENLKSALEYGWLAGDGMFTKKCNQWLEKKLSCHKALITHSCTAALEMMGILSNVGAGDEVIMPSFTFTSTANAFVLRNATPVFVDIRSDTLNIDENLIEKAITKKTKAIIVIHYAGVACEMDEIRKIARKHNLLLFEDAAQALLSKYKNRFLGTLGDLAGLSFHETKNVISGEGGALIINNKSFSKRAEIIREKGTNRSMFLRGEVDKYSWVDIGSSYLPSEIVTAFLYAQLEKASLLTKKRLELWENYNNDFENLERSGKIKRPTIPDSCSHNAHIFYILAKGHATQVKLVEYLKRKGVLAVTHYVPLHSAPAGMKYGRTNGNLKVTDEIAKTLVRLPLHYSLSSKDQEYVIKTIYNFYKNN